MSSRRRSTPISRANSATRAGKTAGAVTVKMRDFDKTMNAVKGMGPEIATRSLPVIAMAKGLAKTESDGALSWLVEIGDDRSIKVNGIPLGKAPQLGDASDFSAESHDRRPIGAMDFQNLLPARSAETRDPVPWARATRRHLAFRLELR